MQTRSVFTATAFVALSFLPLGCNNSGNQTTDQQQTPAAKKSAYKEPPPQSKSQRAEDKDATQGSEKTILAALNEKITEKFPPVMANPFPAGTKALSVKFDDNVATVDFNSNFSNLANAGDSQESLAQKMLQRTLAKYSNVKMMRVTVEGKPFKSQATDWTTPFAVKEESFDAATKKIVDEPYSPEAKAATPDVGKSPPLRTPPPTQGEGR